jgi:hypothetical protein
MKGIRCVEPKSEVLVHQSLQDRAQVLFKTHEQGVVIEGKISHSPLSVPVENLLKNLMGILSQELGVQETTGTVFTMVRAPGGGDDRNRVQAVRQVESGKGDLPGRRGFATFKPEVTKFMEKFHHGVK